MNYKIKVSPTFVKNIKRLKKKYPSIKDDYANFLDEVKTNPGTGIDLGNGLRKVRMAIKSKGRGKSHGARVITYTITTSVNEGEITLLTIYDKAERENISRQEIEEIVKEVI